jgi:hypothetical protein
LLCNKFANYQKPQVHANICCKNTICKILISLCPLYYHLKLLISHQHNSTNEFWIVIFRM